MLTVRDVGEQGILQRVQAFCPPELVGDDAAILNPQPGQSLVVTTDLMVDGVHFSDRTTAPEDVGWRAAAANLSDLAAMGATPLGITVGLGLPGELAVTWVERLYQGLTDCLSRYQTPVVGGDVVRSPVISVAIAAFGQAAPNRIIRRSSARPGDTIMVTGYHGAARAGLELLLHPNLENPLSLSQQASLIQAHQHPIPRLDVLPLLGLVADQQPAGPTNSTPCIEPPAVAEPIAGMDSSDGLADAIVQICRASGVGANINRSQVPIPPAVIHWVGPDQGLEWALYGGEDFELVLCLPPTVAKFLVAQLGPGAACIGQITTDPGVWLVDDQGQPLQILTLEQGFQHFT
jgi:thiamine-monophosphate kinase